MNSSPISLIVQEMPGTIEATSDEEAQRLCRFGWGEVTFAELLLYTMRHVAGHAAQLNLLLGQTTGAAPMGLVGAGSSTRQA